MGFKKHPSEFGSIVVEGEAFRDRFKMSSAGADSMKENSAENTPGSKRSNSNEIKM